MQQFDQHVQGGIAEINTVLHSHHDRHHQVEDRLGQLRQNLHQLLSEQHQQGLRIANVVRMELKSHIDHFEAKVARLEQRLDAHLATRQLPTPAADAKLADLASTTTSQLQQLQHRLSQLESCTTAT